MNPEPFDNFNTEVRSHVDLFSGIGGFALGLSRAGQFNHVFVEYEDHLQRVLRKNFPDAEIHGDIRNFSPSVSPWIMTGGFPCQDISRANTKKDKGGINGKRSGLWKEYNRCIRECRPKYVIIENVYDLLKQGFEVVLEDLAESGYDATWATLDSQFFRVPQRRRRIYILGFRDGIARGSDPFNHTGRSDGRLRQRVDLVRKKRKWYFEEGEGTQHPLAYFTRQRSDKFDLCGVASTLAKRDYKSFTDLILHGDGSVRKLSIQERLRLQGIPEEWLDDCGLSTKQAYEANGMTVTVVTWIAQKLIEYDNRLELQK